MFRLRWEQVSLEGLRFLCKVLGPSQPYQVLGDLLEKRLFKVKRGFLELLQATAGTLNTRMDHALGQVAGHLTHTAAWRWLATLLLPRLPQAGHPPRKSGSHLETPVCLTPKPFQPRPVDIPPAGRHTLKQCSLFPCRSESENLRCQGKQRQDGDSRPLCSTEGCLLLGYHAGVGRDRPPTRVTLQHTVGHLWLISSHTGLGLLRGVVDIPKSLFWDLQ